MLKRNDVFFVTPHQVIQWIKTPVPLEHINQFEEWNCKEKMFEPNEIACNVANMCKLYSRVLQQNRYFYTCNECPIQYPWIRNEFGLD